MLEQLQQLYHRYSALQARLSDPDTYADAALVSQLNQEAAELEPLAHAYEAYQSSQDALSQAEALLEEETDPELRALAREEVQAERERSAALEHELRVLLLPKDPNDGKNVILELRAGVGGEESALFAHSLFRMYQMYAEQQGWTVEIASANETELGGLKELSCTISGANVYNRLKYESGVHRVQRVPETESGGRVHTSTATVAVLPEVDEVTLEIRKEDVKMDVFRSSGAGGQHVNKTSSAVRLTHLPTGMVVECQQERSQFQNRDKAMEILRARLYEQMLQSQTDSVTAQRRSQVGSGMRNERIRTYNFPQGRVTDHRIGLTLYKIQSIMDGDLDELIDALAAADQAEKLASQSQT